MPSMLTVALVGACLGALVACTSAATGTPGATSVSTATRRSSSTGTTTPTPSSAVAGTNRTLARAAAADVFKQFPVPPGSTRTNGAPRLVPEQRRLGAYIGPVDTSLTRSGWWLVPLRYDRLVAWYAARTPADVRSTYPPDSTTSAAAADFYWVTKGGSPAYSTPVDVVDYARLGPRLTAIRTDVTLAARADRTALTLAPMTVTSIEVTKRAIDGPGTAPKTVTVTNPDRVHTVIAAFNSLSGAFASTQPQGCGSPTGIVYTYAVTFHWPRHTLAVDAGAALCGIGRGLTRDGRSIRQTVQDESNFDAALAAAGHR